MVAASYNKYNTKVNHQQGGAAIIARDQLVHRSCARVYNSLGRWMVMTFRGRAGTNLHIVLAYRSQDNTVPYSVYQ